MAHPRSVLFQRNLRAILILLLVEVRLNAKASARFDTIRSLVHTFVMSHDRIGIPSVPEGWQDLPELASSVEIINICEAPCPKQSLSTEEVILHVHVYQPADGDSFEEFSNDSGGRDDGDTMTASVCELPNKSWDGLWNSLIYADDIKLKMLDYIHATLLLSDASVDCKCLHSSWRCVDTTSSVNLVSWNRVVLLYGPPGTGKTSFCRALAQKLSIRLSHRCMSPLSIFFSNELNISIAILMRDCSRSTPIPFFQNGFRSLASSYNVCSIVSTS